MCRASNPSVLLGSARVNLLPTPLEGQKVWPGACDYSAVGQYAI